MPRNLLRKILKGSYLIKRCTSIYGWLEKLKAGCIETKGFIMIKRNLLGQSAIEYLMTYGWMLLVVAVVGGAVFSITGDQNINSVSGFSGSDVLIDDFGVNSDDELSLSMTSGAGSRVVVSRVNVSDPVTGQWVSKKFTGESRISVGSQKIFELPNVTSGNSSNSLNVEINYNNSGLTNLAVSGTISGNLQLTDSGRYEGLPVDDHQEIDDQDSFSVFESFEDSDFSNWDTSSLSGSSKAGSGTKAIAPEGSGSLQSPINSSSGEEYVNTVFDRDISGSSPVFEVGDTLRYYFSGGPQVNWGSHSGTKMSLETSTGTLGVKAMNEEFTEISSGSYSTIATYNPGETYRIDISVVSDSSYEVTIKNMDTDTVVASNYQENWGGDLQNLDLYQYYDTPLDPIQANFTVDGIAIK